MRVQRRKRGAASLNKEVAHGFNWMPHRQNELLLAGSAMGNDFFHQCKLGGSQLRMRVHVLATPSVNVPQLHHRRLKCSGGVGELRREAYK